MFMDINTRVRHKDFPHRTGTVYKVHDDDDTILVQWDEPLPYVSDSRRPITLVHAELLEELPI